MRKGRVAATRFFIIVIVLMTFFVLSGPTVFARQGPPQVPPGKDIVDENKEDKHEDKNRGWDNVVEKFIKNGITLPGHVNNGLFDYIREALEEDLKPMVMVGEQGVDYIIPTGTHDYGRATVAGGFHMAIHQTTYELWYEVRVWAEANGYTFQNQGREGHDGIMGAEPTERMLEPVTSVSWRDVVIWLNAMSEMHGYEPVYRKINGDIIMDSRHHPSNPFRSYQDEGFQTDHNGYRLPTSNEWEMAARWKNDTESTDGSILVEGRYWTPGSYASGATADIYNETSTQAVAWYSENSGLITQPVGQLLPNHLGIYDMSGNVYEWTYSHMRYSYRIFRGGSYRVSGDGRSADFMQLGYISATSPFQVLSSFGFRIVINHLE